MYLKQVFCFFNIFKEEFKFILQSIKLILKRNLYGTMLALI